ncbi:cell division protein FtsQ/DivIB [Arenimonas fontis]|uniref:Cell division protein FtsQ n=1 Tax=Arenimonas fontis TaxID=2608255 RepID=A0A5B2ZCZ2_9GAMM|nr:cell division protein FtsQ/DivIB [Arenimonas fontis]KAA2284941.1 cell division protein FtsQ/DivIB [Arenimonas fontis]
MNALLRIAAWSLAIALVAAPVVAVLNGWIGGERWPMRRLAVTGEFRQVDEQAVREAVLPLVRRGFFAVDLDEVRTAVADLPWVKTVQVRKRWPDRLEVSLTEHTPVARWGEGRMLSEAGELFAAPAGAGAHLPLFEGPEDRIGELMAVFSSARPLFLPLGRSVEVVRMSARGSWSLVLDDGTVLEAGRGDPQPRLARFARMWPQLRKGDPRPLLRADLRYTNGFAVVWGETPAPAPAQTLPGTVREGA